MKQENTLKQVGLHASAEKEVAICYWYHKNHIA